MTTFIKDFVSTFAQFVVHGLLMVLHLAYHALHKVYVLCRIIVEDAMIPAIEQCMEVMECVVMHMYEEMLLCMSVVCLGVADFCICMSHMCQNKVKQFQKKRRWL